MFFPSKSISTLAIPLVAGAIILTACGGDERAGTAPPTPIATPATTTTMATPGATTPTATPSATAAAVAIPETQVGRQLRWFLDAVVTPPIPDDQLSAHLSASFLSQVPPAEINKVLQSLAGLRLDKLTEVQPTALTGLVTATGQRLQISISVDGTGKINGLIFTPAGQPAAAPAPAPAPASWAEVDRRLRAIAPDVGFLAAEVTSRATCRTVHAIEPGTPRPLASMFKLYVLGAVAERIRDGKLAWDTPLTIKRELKSVPSGRLQDRPDNSTVPVREAAKLMISISDNTGTDLLIHKVGRSAVEAQLRKWSGHTTLNTPLPTTRDLSILKGADYPRLAKEYLSRNAEQRRVYLDTTVAKTPLSKVKEWTKPHDIDTLEWFGSPDDVCRAYAGLSALDNKPLNKPLSEVLSTNDVGLRLGRKEWRTIWFKGGSEPGVLTMGFLARSAEGKTYVVTALTGNPLAALNERAAATEILSLIRGSFALAKKGS